MGTKYIHLISGSVQWRSRWAMKYFKIPELIKYRIALLQNYSGKAQFPESAIHSNTEPLQQNQTPGEAANLQFSFCAKFIPPCTTTWHPRQWGIHLVFYIFRGYSMHLFSFLSCGMIFRLYLYFPGFNSDLQAGRSAEEKRPSELSAFKKKGILQDTVSSWQHSPRSWSTQSSLKLQAAGKKQFFRKIKKIYKKHLWLSKSTIEFCNSM